MSLVFEADRRHTGRTVDDCRYTNRKCQQHLNLSCAAGDGLPALRRPVRPSMGQYFVVACWLDLEDGFICSPSTQKLDLSSLSQLPCCYWDCYFQNPFHILESSWSWVHILEDSAASPSTSLSTSQYSGSLETYDRLSPSSACTCRQFLSHLAHRHMTDFLAAYYHLLLIEFFSVCLSTSDHILDVRASRWRRTVPSHLTMMECLKLEAVCSKASTLGTPQCQHVEIDLFRFRRFHADWLTGERQVLQHQGCGLPQRHRQGLVSMTRQTLLGPGTLRTRPPGFDRAGLALLEATE